MKDNSITVTLTKPIQIGDEMKASLTFTAPTLGDLIDIEESAPDAGMTKRTAMLMARTSGLSLAEIGQMSLGDYNRCDRDLRPLLGNSEGAAGEKSPS